MCLILLNFVHDLFDRLIYFIDLYGSRGSEFESRFPLQTSRIRLGGFFVS